MQEYKIITTIDITRSDAVRNSDDKIALGQQSNFDTLIQTIGLRANVQWKHDPIKIGNRWLWSFQVEHADVFLLGKNPVGLLEEDLHNVPVVSNLTNSVAVYPPVFQTTNSDPNTWIQFNSYIS
jgi:hypothetical protein